MPRVQPKGQVTLEREHREAVGIRPGDDVEETVVHPGDVVQQAGILVVPKRGGFSRFLGLLGKDGDTDALMRELRGRDA